MGRDDATVHSVWAMPNSDTFSVPPIGSFVDRWTDGLSFVCDPFARNVKVANITNDLDPDTDAMFHMDALKFLMTLRTESVDAVIYDPPYSNRQASECYRKVGLDKFTGTVTNAGYWAKVKDECSRITKPGGIALCFGWNSNGMGKSRGFDIMEILLVAHGGKHNDTICMAEVKTG